MKSGFGWLVLALLAGFAVQSSYAQGYPNRPIKLIVPWSPGGSADVVLRAMAESAGKTLGQPIVVENKPGASGTTGAATMAAVAKPDGYTIAQMMIALYRMPSMQETSWDPLRDFTYIVHLAGFTFGITTRADSPFKTFQDAIEYAKKNPGKVTYASPGQASTPHLAMEQILARVEATMLHVPYKGGPESTAAVLGGHTMLQADSTTWKGLVNSEKLRLLVLWTAQRSKNWPEVPTLTELGIPLVFDSPFGIGGPKGMDPAVVARLHDAFKKALDDPLVQNALATYDMPPNYKNTEDYRKFVAESVVAERKVVQMLGLDQRKKN